MEMDDAETVGAAGLLQAEEIATAIYKRNEVEAATKKDIHIYAGILSLENSLQLH